MIPQEKNDNEGEKNKHSKEKRSIGVVGVVTEVSSDRTAMACPNCHRTMGTHNDKRGVRIYMNIVLSLRKILY